MRRGRMKKVFFVMIHILLFILLLVFAIPLIIVNRIIDNETYEELKDTYKYLFTDAYRDTKEQYKKEFHNGDKVD
jgi:hypothetical protein